MASPDPRIKCPLVTRCPYYGCYYCYENPMACPYRRIIEQLKDMTG